MPAKFTTTAGPTLPEIREEVASELAFITRSVSPLLIALGFPDNLKTVFNIRHRWLEDALLPNSATINQVGGHAPGDTVLNVDPIQGLNFRVGDELQVEGSNELMLVTVVAPNTVTVTRGIKGTTAITIPDNSTLKRVGNPAVEDETAPDARPTSRNPIDNYTQIFRDTAKVTRSMELVHLHAGVDDELDLQIDRVMKDLMRDIAGTVVRGKAQAANPEGTSTTTRTMNGIIHSILGGSSPSVQDAAGAGLDERLLNLILEDMFSKGGEPMLLAAPPAQRRRLSALLQGRQRYRPEDTQLGAIVETFVSDFGEINVLKPDIFIPNDTVLMLDPAKIRMVKLGEGGNPFEVMPLAKTGLTSNREVVGEFGLEIMNAGDGGQGMIQNLATN